MKKHQNAITAWHKSLLLLGIFALVGGGSTLAAELTIESISPTPGEVFDSSEYPEGIEVRLNTDNLSWTKGYFNYTTKSEVSYRNGLDIYTVPSGASTSAPITFSEGVLKINFLQRYDESRSIAKADSDFNICITGVKNGEGFLSASDLPEGVEIDPTTGDLYIHYIYDYVTSEPVVYPDSEGIVYSYPDKTTSYSYTKSDNKNFFIPVATTGLLRIANTAIRDNRLFYDKDLTQLVPGFTNSNGTGTIRYDNLEEGHTYYYCGNFESKTGTLKFYFEDGFTLQDSRPTELPANGTIQVLSGDELPFYPPAEGKLTLYFTGVDAAQWFQVYEDNEWVVAPYAGEYNSASLTYAIEPSKNYRLVVPAEGDINTTLSTTFKEKLILKVSVKPTPETAFPFNKSNEIYVTFSPNNNVDIDNIKIDYQSANGPVTIPGSEINVKLDHIYGTTTNYINVANLPNIFKGTGTTAGYPPMEGDEFSITLSGFTVNNAEVDELDCEYANDQMEIVLPYLFDPYEGMVKTEGEINWPEYFTEYGAYPAEPVVIEYSAPIQLPEDIGAIEVWGMESHDPSGRDLPQDADIPRFDLVKYSSVSDNKLTIDFNAAGFEYSSLDGMMTVSIINLLSGSTAVAPVVVNIPFKSTKPATCTLSYAVEGQAILGTKVLKGDKVTVTFPENEDFRVVSISFNGEDQTVADTYTTPTVDENSVLDIVYEFAGDINYDFTTGIDQPADCPYTVTHEGEAVVLNGVKAGDAVRVYTPGGLMMANLGAVPSGSSVVTFKLATGKVYIIMVNDKAIKVRH